LNADKIAAIFVATGVICEMMFATAITGMLAATDAIFAATNTIYVPTVATFVMTAEISAPTGGTFGTIAEGVDKPRPNFLR
jgi:hypothetical protein